MGRKQVGVIYKWENLVNGKVYIGQSTQVNTRYSQHLSAVRRGSNTYLHKSIRKYGRHNFGFTILCSVFSIADLDEMEITLIYQYNSQHPNGYNMTSGGGGRRGHVPSAETRRKVSERMRGARHPMFGKHHTEATKEKLRTRRKGVPQSRESIERVRLANKGKRRTPEFCRRISRARTGIKLTEATKKKLSDINKGSKHPQFGKPRSEATKEKIRAATTGRILPEEHKQNLLGSHGVPVLFNGVAYGSVSAAAKSIGVTHKVIARKVRLGECTTLTREEYVAIIGQEKK